MYLWELVTWFGWAVFYGSVAVLIAFPAWWAFFVFVQVPTEERQLEERFGESYRAFKQRVPRWFGRPRVTR